MKAIIRVSVYHRPDTEKDLRETVDSMKEEHAGYYGTPCGASKGCGLTVDDHYQGWMTSGGNYLGVALTPRGDLLIKVEGFRHGIPWQFLPRDLKTYLERVHHKNHYGTITPFFIGIENYESRRPGILPWIATRDHSMIWGVRTPLPEVEKENMCPYCGYIYE